MWRARYQKVAVVLPAMTFSRLEQAALNKRRMADDAVEKIRVAVFELFPPARNEEWGDKSRYQGAGRHMLLLWYDLICHALRRRIGGGVEPEKYAVYDEKQSYPLTINVPPGLMKWIEEISRNRRMTVSEATVYAIEYGLQVLDSQGSPHEVEQNLRQTWRDIWRLMWNRS